MNSVRHEQVVQRRDRAGARRRRAFEQMRAAGLRYEPVGHFFTGRIVLHALNFVR